MAAIKLENAQLVQQMIEKKRMEHELALASDIQQNLLPSQAPQIQGWDIAGMNTPCYTIGGDYFDYISKPSGRLAFALGDVSGKGAGAALMMMVLRATVHAGCQQQGNDVVSILSQTNQVMYHNTPEHAYVTFFLGDLDPRTGELLYVNAGHIPPIVYRAKSGEADRLETGGTVVGMFESVPYEQGKTTLEPGDMLVVFTDGISESWGEDGEEIRRRPIGGGVEEPLQALSPGDDGDHPARSRCLRDGPPHRRPNTHRCATLLKVGSSPPSKALSIAVHLSIS